MCGQKVHSINVWDAYAYYNDTTKYINDTTKYIKSSDYNIFLYTPKTFKRYPQFYKKEECIWDKKKAIEYCNTLKNELDILGCDMQKVKSKSICRYEGMKNGKVITLNLSKIDAEFFSVTLSIANKTKDYDFHVVWD